MVTLQVWLLLAALACSFASRHHHHQKRRNNDDAPWSTTAKDDELKSLPGWNGSLPMKSYAGYLPGSDDGRIGLFYWMFESQRDPSNDPVLFWYNGGPACSSFGGMFMIHGPFRVDHGGKTLRENPWTWTQVTTMVSIDAPPDTGFSYEVSGQTAWTDDEVAEMNAHAIDAFFKKFHKLAERDFFISGESYAGIYIPTMAKLIVERIEKGQFSNPYFQGMAIGNGYYDYTITYNTQVQFMYYHGLISYDCPETCNYSKHLVPGFAGNADTDHSKCGDMVNFIDNTITFDWVTSGFNVMQACYDITRLSRMARKTLPDLISSLDIEEATHTDNADGYPCYNEKALGVYFSQSDVQNALHVSQYWKDQHDTWKDCSDPAFDNYNETVFSVFPQMKFLLNEPKKPLRFLIYNGDVDSICSFLSASAFTNQLMQRMKWKKTEKYGMWKFADAPSGFYEQWNDRLTLLTVKGAGHMVPLDRPGPSLQMIQNFLENHDYNTPLQNPLKPYRHHHHKLAKLTT